jgi:hypothetical protein
MTAFTIPASVSKGVVLGNSFSMPRPGDRRAWGVDEQSYQNSRLHHLLPDALDGKPVDLATIGRNEKESALLRRRVIELLIERAMGGFMLPEPGRRWLFRRTDHYGEWGRLRHIASAARPSRGNSLYVPEGADDEFLELQARARTDFCALLVNLITQNLYVSDFRAPDASSSSPAWKGWQRNKMNARQTGVHRTVATCGYSYAFVDADDRGDAVYLPWSPLRTFAWYPDDWTDEDPSMIQAWPSLVLRLDRPNRISVYDGYQCWRWRIREEYAGERDGFSRAQLVSEQECVPYRDGVKTDDPDAAHPPVVRLVGRTDLIGDPVGEVEPCIPVQERIEETVFSVLMAQTYAGFRQRWATGMVTPKNPDGSARPVSLIPFQSIVTNESADGRFGDFGTADLNGYVGLMELHLRFGAALSQAPPQALLGSMDNVGADGLAAAETGNQRRGREYKTNLGEGWGQMLREGARVEGDTATAEDDLAEIDWADTEARSLQSLAQALGTVASTLDVPKRALWPRLPVTRGELEGWAKMADAEEAKDPFRGLAPGVPGAGPPPPAGDAPENEPLDGPGTERRR